MRVEFYVPGEPIPQGSTRSFVRAGRAITTSDNKRTKPWRLEVASMALEARPEGWPMRGTAVAVSGVFYFARPKSHYGRRGLLSSAPAEKITRPDVDKLGRAILDALTGVLYHDDSQVVSLTLRKGFGALNPGAVVTVSSVPA